MPRPKSKNELLLQSQDNYDKLLLIINNCTAQEKSRQFPAGMLNRNIRDVIGHLHEWHIMMLRWYEVGMSGDKPAMPAEGFTWKTTPELNAIIQKKYSNTEFELIIEQFERSHHAIQKLIESHTNEELFEKKRYKWTGSTSMGAYLISATSSHYDWATKLIKKALA